MSERAGGRAALGRVRGAWWLGEVRQADSQGGGMHEAGGVVKAQNVGWGKVSRGVDLGRNVTDTAETESGMILHQGGVS